MLSIVNWVTDTHPSEKKPFQTLLKTLHTLLNKTKKYQAPLHREIYDP